MLGFRRNFAGGWRRARRDYLAQRSKAEYVNRSTADRGLPTRIATAIRVRGVKPILPSTMTAN